MRKACLPLTALEDFEAAGQDDPVFAGLAEIVKRHNMLWSLEAALQGIDWRELSPGDKALLRRQLAEQG